MAAGRAERGNGRADAPAIVTVPVYLDAVRRLHGLGSGEMARALRVNPSVLRRWIAWHAGPVVASCSAP